MKLYRITVQDKDTFYPYGPYLVEEKPTAEELDRLKENVGILIKQR